MEPLPEAPLAADPPLEDRAVEAARVQRCPVGAEGRANGAPAMAQELLHRAPSGRVPDDHRPVVMGGGDDAVVWREADGQAEAVVAAAARADYTSGLCVDEYECAASAELRRDCASARAHVRIAAELEVGVDGADAAQGARVPRCDLSSRHGDKPRAIPHEACAGDIDGAERTRFAPPAR